MEWSGETYEKEGILCRDARATGEKLVRNVEVRYGGQVKTPEVKGKQYIGLYQEIRREPESSQKEEESQGTEIETEKWKRFHMRSRKNAQCGGEVPVLDKKTSDQSGFWNWFFHFDPGRHGAFMDVQKKRKEGKRKPGQGSRLLISRALRSIRFL